MGLIWRERDGGLLWRLEILDGGEYPDFLASVVVDRDKPDLVEWRVWGDADGDWTAANSLEEAKAIAMALARLEG